MPMMFIFPSEYMHGNAGYSGDGSPGLAWWILHSADHQAKKNPGANKAAPGSQHHLHGAARVRQSEAPMDPESPRPHAPVKLIPIRKFHPWGLFGMRDLPERR